MFLQKKFQHPVALMRKGLQERKTTIEWDNGGKIGNNNNKLIPNVK